MKVIEGYNFVLFNPGLDFHESGALGVVTNTRYVRCFWPRLDRPTRLFAEGSSGIEVMGPPTPRNVVFPADTVFLPVQVNDARLGEPPRWRETDIVTKSDCFFETEADADILPR